MTFFTKSIVSMLFLSFVALHTLAQIGGKTTFDFLNLPTHGRSVSLGGVNITSQDAGEQHDIHMHLDNPALLTPEAQDRLSLAYYGYSAQINQFSLAYGHEFDKLRRFSNIGFSIQYLNYGSIPSYDATGLAIGDVSASEYVIGISQAQRINNFRLGVTLKVAGSQLAGFNATGAFLDVGGTLEHPSKDLRFGLVFNNIGFLLSNYSSTASYAMPLDIRLGASFKPEKMPVRFSLTLHQLSRNNIAYNDPSRSTTINANGQLVFEEVSTTDKALRRVVIAAEILPSKSFNIRAGYNFLRRREMTIDARPGFVGFSFGVVARVRAFEIAYSRSLQHISGGTNNFTIVVDTQKLWR